jgi:hypothetical protein
MRWLWPMTAPTQVAIKLDSRCQASSTSNQAKVTVPLACH